MKYLKSTTLRYKDLKIGVCGKDSIPLRKKKKSEKTRIIKLEFIKFKIVKSYELNTE